MTTLRIGTRGSQLALWQARTVARLITGHGGPACELVIIRTSGDEKPTTPPDPPALPGTPFTRDGPRDRGTPGTHSRSGGPSPSSTATKATFVKEIEDALLDGQIDVAVHSSKDLSATFPEGLTIGATLAREDPRDAMLLPQAEIVGSVDALKARLGTTPRIGTSSVRRAAQLTALFPGATFTPIRGNVDTRLRKLDAGACDAGVLACAGLKRLGLDARISLALPLDICIPAPGQGIVTVQVRSDQAAVRATVAAINDSDAFDALTAERAIVRSLGGGCQMPLGAHARVERHLLAVTAAVISPDARRIVRASGRGERAAAADIGTQVAESLLRGGAAEILAR